MGKTRENTGMAADKKSETMKRWSMKQGIKVEKFIFRHRWIFVISRILSQSFKKSKVQRQSRTPRWDIVKDGSGSYAVFSEQGSSTSQMTAAKVTEIISRLPGCAGQAADAVSAYTQVKMEDAPKLFKNPRSECPDIWIRLQKHKWPKPWSSMEDPVVPLERNLYGHLLAELFWKKAIRESSIGTR